MPLLFVPALSVTLAVIAASGLVVLAHRLRGRLRWLLATAACLMLAFDLFVLLVLIRTGATIVSVTPA